MEISNYAIEAEVEATHWWFVGRRELFRRVASEFRPGPDTPILDVGTSTGTNLRVLKEMGCHNVTGVDASDESIRYCREKGLGEVQKGNVSDLQFEDEAFAVVFATDIIEHVDDDAGALREIARVLKPDGRVLLTVPAFESLWGLQDEVSHHKRRYRKNDLVAQIAAAGLVTENAFYFNYILFVPIWLARQAIRVFGIRVASENELNSPLINSLLTKVFEFDVATAPALKPPFGVSVLAVARKPRAGDQRRAASCAERRIVQPDRRSDGGP